MARALDYSKLNDYRKVTKGGSVLGGPKPKAICISTTKPKKKNTPLKGAARRNQEIRALQNNKYRNENQEKRLQSLLKIKKSLTC